MKRRTFLAGVLAVASLPRSLAAQTAPKVVRIGWLTAQQASSLTPYLEALRAALAELGYVEGRNLTIEFRFGDDEIERVPALAAELVRVPVDLIVAQGAAAFEVHKLALPIPVVFSMSADPVSAGFVDSLTRPRGNMTGVTLMAMELSGKRLALLRDIAPAVRRVAVVGNPEHPGAHLERAYSEERGRQLDLVIDYVPTPTRDVLTKAFATMSANPPQAISVLPDGFAVQNRRSIIDFATSLHVPVISGWPVFARCAVHLRAARYRVLPALGLLCRSHPQGRQARRSADRAADEIRACPQCESCQDTGSRLPARAARARRRGDRMKRRDFITLLGGAAAAWPLAARAQQQPVRPLIGILSPLSAASAARNIVAFRSGLRDLGYLEGRNATLEIRYGDGAPERMAPLAQELVALKPDVLVAGARSSVLAAQAATRTIPIVIFTVDDPVALGLAQSIARPSGNITGIWFDYDSVVGKRLEFLKLAVPALERVGVIVNPDDAQDVLTLPRLPAATRALGVTVEQFEVRDLTKFDAVAAAIERAGVQALLVGDGPTLNSARADIIAIVARLRLPAMYGFREFADAGGLMSYGYNLPDAYRQTARLVVKILKGDRPSDLPFERPARYELIVNLKAAKAIGLTIPDSFVLLADEVIE